MPIQPLWSPATIRGAAGLLTLALAPLASTGCGNTRGAPDGETTTVVLVTIDTWRRDATGFLGGIDPSPTPFLDQLASRGYVAADAVAPVPQTGPSHWSMFSGRWPWRDGFRTNGDAPVEGHPPTLAAILQDHGWRTAGFVSCVVLDHRFGFAEGFEHFDDRVRVRDQGRDPSSAERSGDETVNAALDWLRPLDAGEHAFLWVHLFDPHFPYQAPQRQFEGRHGDYLDEVAFADAQVRALYDGLSAMGRGPEETAWVVLSDHGEGLGEHGEETHSFLLHGATTRIPLLIAGPGVQARQDESPASTVDVLPTLLALLGYDAEQVDGIDLLQPRDGLDRAIPLESVAGLREFGLSPAFGLRTKSWLWEGAKVDRLWNVESDPDELIDLGPQRTGVVSELRARREDTGTPPVHARSAPRPELEGQLQALGYAGGNSIDGGGDPREFVSSGEEWHADLMTLVHAREFEKAEGLARKFLDRYPNSPSTWVEAGFISIGLEDLAEAERRFRMATGLDRTSTKAQLNLANVLFMREDLEGAEREYQGVLEKDPTDLFALSNFGQLLARKNRFREAAEVLSEFLDRHPDHEQATVISAMLRQWKHEGKY